MKLTPWYFVAIAPIADHRKRRESTSAPELPRDGVVRIFRVTRLDRGDRERRGEHFGALDARRLAEIG